MRLNEKMGVPEGIDEVAKELLNEIKLSLRNTELFFDEDILLTNFNLKINEFNLELPVFINIKFNPEYDNFLYQFSATRQPDKIEFKGNKLKQIGLKNIKLFIYAATKKIDVDKIIDGIKVDIIAHELKHFYDAYYRSIDSESSADYSSYSVNFGLKSISDFLYLLYYTTIEENLVRPTEFYTKLKEENITKKDFREFIQKSGIFEKLNKSENFTLDKLISDIENDPNLDDVLDKIIKQGYESKGDKIEDIINLIYINILNLKLEAIKGELSRYVLSKSRGGNIFDKILGKMNKDEEKKADNYFKGILSKSLKYENNPRVFFEKLIKKLNFDAKKTKRKLLKIYDMIPDNKKNENDNSQILNWELFLELKGKPLTTSIKKFK